jgi:predicted RNase H-like nuclease (RuvC/YqgF family)
VDAIERWDALKRKVERLKDEASRRQGSLESLVRRLREEYGVNVSQAEKEVVTLEKKVARLERECGEKVQEIEEEVE